MNAEDADALAALFKPLGHLAERVRACGQPARVSIDLGGLSVRLNVRVTAERAEVEDADAADEGGKPDPDAESPAEPSDQKALAALDMIAPLVVARVRTLTPVEKAQTLAVANSLMIAGGNLYGRGFSHSPMKLDLSSKWATFVF